MVRYWSVRHVSTWRIAAILLGLVDHSRFVSIAEDAGTKLAAYLDLAEAAALMKSDAAKACLREVMAMLGGLRGYLERKE